MAKSLNSAARLGFHYFPDAKHYREGDLRIWLPELQALGASWLTLIAPLERAIPEDFLRGLIEAGVEPVLHFKIPIDRLLLDRDLRSQADLSVLFGIYARWGVRYAVLFDRPNLRRSWPASAWSQADLVERFIDIFLPAAANASQAGLSVVFPPLEPGGDYWDTAFLHSALRSLNRRSQVELLDTLALGVQAWTYNRSLDWGIGGPESWPGAQPYHTPTDSQDQLGFRIFEWYQAIAQAELGRMLPILILKAGSRPGDWTADSPSANDPVTPEPFRQHAEANLAIAQLMTDPVSPQNIISPPEIIQGKSVDRRSSLDTVTCVNFWLLSAESGSPEATDAWYQPDGKPLPVVSLLKQWQLLQRNQPEGTQTKNILSDSPPGTHPIDHYLLLPLYAWGVSDWDLESIHPFLHENHPTVGFSPFEARLARRVTIFSETPDIHEDTLSILRIAGCQVERIDRDGTLLAI